MTSRLRARSAASVGVLVLVTLGACSGRDAPDAAPPGVREHSTHSSSTSSPRGQDDPEAPTDTEDDMQIGITIGDQRFTATLDGSAAADDLVAQLPVTVDMSDHGGVEKTGPLPGPLSLAGQPDAADPDVGDVGYYAPGNDLVLYHGDQSSFPGIVVLGRLDGNAAARIAELEGPVTATVEAG